MITILVAMAAGCGQGKKAERFSALPFPDAAVPGMMTDPQDRAEYLAEHYWDAITDPSRTYPSDSLHVSGVRKAEVEQKFADWTYILNSLPFRNAEKAVARLYDKALACETKDNSSELFEFIVELSDRYFYDPNSPLRNEDF